MRLKTAIVVIDMQSRNLWYEKEALVREPEKQIDAIAQLIRFGQANDMPRYLVEGKGSGETIPALRELSYTSSHTKNNWSSFSSDTFCKAVRDVRIERLIVAGVYASECVRSTAHDARNRGLSVCTSRDLIRGWEELEDYIQYYKDNTDFYETHQDLIASLERERLAA